MSYMNLNSVEQEEHLERRPGRFRGKCRNFAFPPKPNIYLPLTSLSVVLTLN